MFLSNFNQSLGLSTDFDRSLQKIAKRQESLNKSFNTHQEYTAL